MSNVKHKKGLVLGIGNSGREDDGLGWLFLDHLQKSSVDCDLEYRYQLQIEDAELISRYQKVLLVDASKSELKEGFELKPCPASAVHGFSSHELMPETVLYLAEKLFSARPCAHILAIQGYQWRLKSGISKQALVNLENAFKFFKKTRLVS